MHCGIERRLFSYRVGSCEGVQSRGQQFIAAVIEDYFEGRVEPVEVASAGAGEDHMEPALVSSAPAEANFPNWGN